MRYAIANWKMNMKINDVTAWLEVWKKLGFDHKNVTVIIAPSFPHLYLINQIDSMECCAQDTDSYEKGARTGAVGAFQLVEFCNYCIVGHSERHENREIVIKKANACLNFNITPIICFKTVDEAPGSYIDKALLAWEDPENISKNGILQTTKPDEIANTIDEIRKVLPSEAKVLYGGSVSKSNISDLIQQSDIDGVLVGSASLDPEHFYEICSNLANY